VRGDLGTTNFGDEALLYAGTTNPYKTYLRFDLGSVTANVSSAQLELTANAYGAFSNGLFLYGLEDGAAGDGDPAATNPGWTEAGLNFNNAPANDASSNTGFTSDAVLLATVDYVGIGKVQTFSSPALINFINNDTNGLVTFMLSATTHARFYSKEGTSTVANDIPALRLTLVPEPGVWRSWA
jgi:hypothetical protein